MTTLKDVASSLGLSVATVSRALNDFPEVGDRTKERVRQRALEMGYRPNQAARKLVSGHSGMVALVVQQPRRLAADSTFFLVASELARQLGRRDYDLVIHFSELDDEVEPYRRLAAKGTLDGFIVNAPKVNDERLKFLARSGTPFVVHGRPDSSVGGSSFDVENYKLAYDATTAVLHLGHTRVAMLNGDSKYTYAVDRHQGFRDALETVGLKAEAYFEGPATEDFGHATGLAVLGAISSSRPTATICASMPVAAGVYKAVRDLGLTIPDDVSIIAHDDGYPQYSAEAFVPPLTTTAANLEDAAEPLVELLLSAILGGSQTRVQHAELRLRASTAKSRGKAPSR